MRISDWSSDVCSSDLVECPVEPAEEAGGLTMRPLRHRLEEGRAKSWCEAESDQHREYHRGNDGDRKLAIDDHGRTSAKRHRNEDRRPHNGAPDKPTRNHLKRLASGLKRGEALL